jgi:hypothetical protein
MLSVVERANKPTADMNDVLRRRAEERHRTRDSWALPVNVDRARLRAVEAADADPLGLDDPRIDPLGLYDDSWTARLDAFEAAVADAPAYVQQLARWLTDTDTIIDTDSIIVAIQPFMATAQQICDVFRSAPMQQAVAALAELHDSINEATSTPSRRHGSAALCYKHGPTIGGHCRRCSRGGASRGSWRR